MLEAFQFRRGVVAIPHNRALEAVFLLPDRGMNQGKSEAILGMKPMFFSLFKPSNGAEFTGGGIKFEDEYHGNNDYRNQITRYTAACREIKEETRSRIDLKDGLDVDFDQFKDIGPSFFVLQIRKNKLCLFSVSAILWLLTQEQENWLVKMNNALRLNRDQMVNSINQMAIRPRDRYIIKGLCTSKYMSQL